MKRLLTSVGLIVCAAFHTEAQGFSNGQAADLVLGQATFITDASSPTNAWSMKTPTGVAVDPTTGKVFVAQYGANRVLRYANSDSLANGAPAEVVIGQVNFSASAANQGGGTPTASTLRNPIGVCVDSRGTLYVADSGNNRVLVFQGASTLLPITNASADFVIGQMNFTTAVPATTATTLREPNGVTVSPDGTLFVADSGNSRVLGYKNIASLTGNGPVADLVVGQINFTSGDASTTRSRLSYPADVLVDSGNHLWIADFANSRVLRFNNASGLPATAAEASGVLGQPNFTSSNFAVTATGMVPPMGLAMSSTGDLFVANFDANRITAYRNAATLANGAAASLVLGQPDFVSNEPALTASGLYEPARLAFDLQGRLFVTDSHHNRTLRYTPAPAPTPVVTVTGKKAFTTTKAKVKIKGKATNGPIARVDVKFGRKTFKARGTTNWNYAARLKPGKNVLKVTAVGTNGKVSKPAKVKITRK